MMKPTEDLVKEHEDIRLMLAIVHEMASRLERGESVEPRHMEEAVEFIRDFADRYHHAKEEDLLFPAMEEAGFPSDSGPIGVMLAEHDEGRAYVRAAAEAIDAYARGETEAAAGFITNIRNYAGLLDQHIEKENQALYPMADNALSEMQQRELRASFDLTDGRPEAVASYERLQGILRELRETYPPSS